MSLEQIVSPTATTAPPQPPPESESQSQPAPAPLESQPAGRLRSWRKKYKKLKLRFENAMSESNRLFKEEKSHLARCRRLQEDIDGLMDAVMACRDENLVPLNPDVESILAETGGLEPSEPDVHLTKNDYLAKLLASLPSSLIQSPDQEGINITYTLQDVLEDPTIQLSPSNYLDGVYEMEYLDNLDPQLEDSSVFEDVNSHPLRLPPSRILPSDRDLANLNQDSVVSWLKRNHPETFIQQEKDSQAVENGTAKAERAPNKRASTSAKRGSTAVKPETDVLVDEEGFYLDPPEKPKGRKVKDDDQSYRPKGGGNRGKRKREEPEPKVVGSGQRGKRVKSQASVAA